MYPQTSRTISTRNADEQVFAKALDLLPDGLAILDSECRQVYRNSAWVSSGKEHSLRLLAPDSSTFQPNGPVFNCSRRCATCGVGNPCEPGKVNSAIQDVASGKRAELHLCYGCDAGGELRQYELKAVPFQDRGSRWICLFQRDISDPPAARDVDTPKDTALVAALDLRMVCVLEWDGEANSVNLNEHAARLLGLGERSQSYPADGLIERGDPGMAIGSILDKLLENLADGSSDAQITWPRAASPGVVRHLLIVGRVTKRGENGAPLQVIATMEDNSALIESERAIRLTEAQYADLTDIAPDAVISTDEAGRIVMFNKSAEQIFGYKALEVMDLPIEVLLAEGDRPKHREHILRFLNMPETNMHMSSRRPIRGRRSNGELFPAEASISKLVSSSGTILSVYLRDITARNQAEEELGKLGRIIDNSLNEIYIFDSSEFRIRKTNHGARENLGYTLEELEGRSLIEFTAGGTSSEWADLVRPLLAGETAHVDFQSEFLRRNGTPYPVTVRIQLVPHETSPVLFAVATDITKQRELERQLSEARRMESLGSFIGSVAHDFNNYLLPVAVYSDILLQKHAMSAKQRRYVEEIRVASEQATGLIRNLLAFTRQNTIPQGVVQPNDILRGMESILQSMLGDTIRLSLECDRGLSKARIETCHLEQIIMVLSANARDAMPDGGTLSIRTRNEYLGGQVTGDSSEGLKGDFVGIEVADTGIGMAEEIRTHIFEPLYTTKDTQHGGGLGLSTVYGIMKSVGGHISCSSTLGRGACFTVLIPSVGVQAHDRTPRSPVGEIVGGRENILLVDDNEKIRMSVSATLRELGYHVKTAESGAKAIEFLECAAYRIDLLLTDVAMPGMKGTMLASHVAARFPGVHVLFMSGYVGASAGENATMLQHENLLVKPFSARALGERVRAVLDRNGPAPGSAETEGSRLPHADASGRAQSPLPIDASPAEEGDVR